jgi:hypothetical protein
VERIWGELGAEERDLGRMALAAWSSPGGRAVILGGLGADDFGADLGLIRDG